jgi:hypothetical protein
MRFVPVKSREEHFAAREKRDESASADVLAEKAKRAIPSESCRLGIMGSALVAIEAMAGGIEGDLDLRVRCHELLNARHGNHRVLLAKMRHHRAFWLFINRIGDAAAIIRHRTGKTREP